MSRNANNYLLQGALFECALFALGFNLKHTKLYFHLVITGYVIARGIGDPRALLVAKVGRGANGRLASGYLKVKHVAFAKRAYGDVEARVCERLAVILLAGIGGLNRYFTLGYGKDIVILPVGEAHDLKKICVRNLLARFRSDNSVGDIIAYTAVDGGGAYSTHVGSGDIYAVDYQSYTVGNGYNVILRCR